MMGLKRYIRPGLAVSVIGHLALLIGGLSFVDADVFHPPPPEAMVVDVVTPDEIPRFEGMPSNLHSAGSEMPSPADGKGPVIQAPPPQPRPQQQQQSPQRPTPQQDSKEAPAPRPPVPEATRAELVHTDKTEPEKQKEMSEPRQSLATLPTQQDQEQPNIAEEVAQYAALGGPLGGGLPEPRVDTNILADDWTVPFRARVGECSKAPAGVEPDDKFSIKIRISFNHDGTLASPPRLLVPAPSAKQRALMERAIEALQTCQPFTMLPPDKYKQWKTMVLYVTPLFSRW